MEAKQRLKFLDGLRGVAILAVVATHATQINGTPATLTAIAGWGARGVQLFFAVSAFTLLSVDQNVNYGRFLARRFFRIAPMFYLAILGYLFLEGRGPRYYAPSGITILDIGATFFFLHAWIPNAASSVVPGGFSIGDEATFYLIFPLLARHVNSLTRSFIFLVGGILISAALYVVVPQVIPGPPALIRSFSYFVFPAQIPAFAVGFVAFYGFKTWQHSKQSSRLARAGTNVIFGIIIVLAISSTAWSRLHLLGDILIGSLLMCVALYPPRWLVSPAITFVGRVSFSVYLIHFAVIGLVGSLARSQPWVVDVAFPLVLALSVPPAAITWLLIEQPMIELGRYLTHVPNVSTTEEALRSA